MERSERSARSGASLRSAPRSEAGETARMSDTGNPKVEWLQVAGEADAWRSLDTPTVRPQAFTASTVAELPDLARRYLQHAISSGTPLWGAVRVAMDGHSGWRGARSGRSRWSLLVAATSGPPPHACSACP